MRITGGQAKGIPIRVPKGTQTRPTSDKVRQGLFNILGGEVSGRKVLDLFAGSGALGIEALSRGAACAVLVEKNPRSACIIANNLQKAGLSDKAEIMKTDFRSALEKLNRRGEVWDLIFIDPPYQSVLLDKVIKILPKYCVISAKSIIVAEHFKKKELPPNILDIPLVQTRVYGQTCLSFFDTNDRLRLEKA